MTDDQVRDVKALTKAAGVTATTTRVRVGHPMLSELAPRPVGGVVLVKPPAAEAPVRGQGSPRNGQRGQQGANARRQGNDRARRPYGARSGQGGAGRRSSRPSGSASR